MKTQFALNGIDANSPTFERLLNSGMNHHTLRTYSIDNRNTYMTVNKGTEEKPVFEPELISNATATLRRDDWVAIDKAVVQAAVPRLNLVSILRSRGLTYAIPGGMGKTVLETSTSGDINDAEISMDGVRQSVRDRPVYGTQFIPLPIIHKDFFFTAREIAVSRNGGSPLDTRAAALGSQKVAELTEKLHLGTYGTYSFGGGTIYGLINFPQRITQVLTDPTDTGWTGSVIVGQVLSMRQKSQNELHFGPWILLISPLWDGILDADYSAVKGEGTVRERLAKLRGIVAIETVDYLPNYDMVLLQLTEDVVRTLSGLDLTTLQWDTHGGMLVNLKVMSISVPQLREDSAGHTGIVHGVAA